MELVCPVQECGAGLEPHCLAVDHIDAGVQLGKAGGLVDYQASVNGADGVWSVQSIPITRHCVQACRIGGNGIEREITQFNTIVGGSLRAAEPGVPHGGGGMKAAFAQFLDTL